MRKSFLSVLFVILLLTSSPCFGGVSFVTDDHIDVGADASILILGDLTGSYLFKANSLPGNGNFMALFVYGGVNDDEDENHVWFFGIWNNSGTIIAIAFHESGAGANHIVASDIELLTATWYRVVVTRDVSANTYDFYINASSDLGVSYTSDPTGGSASDMAIGDNSAGVQEFNGIISEAAIWDVVLTAPEVNTLLTSDIKRISLQMQPANLQGYWVLDDISDGISADGASFLDMSGNGNTGTGNDGANNTGLTGAEEKVSTYQ